MSQDYEKSDRKTKISLVNANLIIWFITKMRTFEVKKTERCQQVYCIMVLD